MVGCAVFVWHDALARQVLVDEAVVDAVRGVCEDCEVFETIEDRVDEPGRERRGEEGIGGGEAGRDGLEAAVGEGDPFVDGDLG